MGWLWSGWFKYLDKNVFKVHFYPEIYISLDLGTIEADFHIDIENHE